VQIEARATLGEPCDEVPVDGEEEVVRSHGQIDDRGKTAARRTDGREPFAVATAEHDQRAAQRHDVVERLRVIEADV
jgi:hypothetical protein